MNSMTYNNYYKFCKKDELSIIAGIFLGLFSIFEPYVLFQISGVTLRITDVPLIIIALIALLRNRKLTISLSSSRFSLLFWYIGFALISCVGLLFSTSSFSPIFRSLFINVAYIFLFEQIWKIASADTLKKTLYIAATVVSVVVLLQFILGNLGVSMWDGKMPGLSLSGHWTSYNMTHFSIRPNGLFQEASYVGLYLMIPLAISLKDGRFRYSILFTLALILSASLVSIGSIAIIYLYVFVFSTEANIDKKIKRNIIILAISLLVFVLVLYNNNAYVSSTIDYMLNRLGGIGNSLQGEYMSSERWRLTGHIDYFKQYDASMKLFGAGESYYNTYFGLEKGYSNNLVTCLLNFGIIGFIWYIIGLIKIIRKCDKGRRVFFWLFVFVTLVDSLWFNWHFFYSITPIMIYDSFDRSEER